MLQKGKSDFVNNSFNQSFINPAANYTAGMEYDEKRGWRIVIGCISKDIQNEKIGNVINVLKNEKKRMALRQNNSKIQKLGTIYREKR